MELLESVSVRPRQARYQAALRPDMKYILKHFPTLLHSKAPQKRSTIVFDLIEVQTLVKNCVQRENSTICTTANALGQAFSATGEEQHYGWFGLMRSEANSNCLPLGCWLPPRGSTVTNTASISFSVFGSLAFRTQRFLLALSS
jgi:hypothetical protein